MVIPDGKGIAIPGNEKWWKGINIPIDSSGDDIGLDKVLNLHTCILNFCVCFSFLFLL